MFCHLHTLSSLCLCSAPVPLAFDRHINIAYIDALIAELVVAAHPAAWPLWQKTRIVHDNGRVDGEATDLEDVLANGSGVDLLLPAVRGVLGGSHPDASEARVQPLGRLRGTLGQDVGDHVEPLAVPGDDPAPHLVGAVARDLATEAAHDRAEGDAEAPLDGFARLGVQHELPLGIVSQFSRGRL